MCAIAVVWGGNEAKWSVVSVKLEDLRDDDDGRVVAADGNFSLDAVAYLIPPRLVS